jgi:hypothetical protein
MNSNLLMFPRLLGQYLLGVSWVNTVTVEPTGANSAKLFMSSCRWSSAQLATTIWRACS